MAALGCFLSSAQAQNHDYLVILPLVKPVPASTSSSVNLQPVGTAPDIGSIGNSASISPAWKPSEPSKNDSGETYPWHSEIVTTVFWIGELAAKNNPVPNNKSSWDGQWQQRFGGVDSPDMHYSGNYKPAAFIPQQNPFYVALPYNDVTRHATKPESGLVVPWFRQAFRQDGVSVCKGRWVAIRKGNRVCYAQWEDCGPFRTDHWQYVFGEERPKPNINKGAGLDVSPAVRDFLGLAGVDSTDWRFVEFYEVPTGPWRDFGTNNIFVSNRHEATAIADNWTQATQNKISNTQ